MYVQAMITPHNVIKPVYIRYNISITSSPTYSNGNTSGGGSTDGGNSSGDIGAGNSAFHILVKVNWVLTLQLNLV